MSDEYSLSTYCVLAPELDASRQTGKHRRQGEEHVQLRAEENQCPRDSVSLVTEVLPSCG